MTIAYGKTLGAEAVRRRMSGMSYAEAKTCPDSASRLRRKSRP